MNSRRFIKLPTRAIDIAGKRFGRLLAVGPIGKDAHNQIIWYCTCQCGSDTTALAYYLRKGTVMSCGCLHRENVSKLAATHGMTGSKAHKVWKWMRQRCMNPSNKSYRNYGGRGITVDSRWDSFENFYADMGGPPKGMSLERVDNDKGYGPENCIWATKRAQMNNTRRNRVYEFNGKTMTLAQWSRRVGISYSTILSRIDTLGWPIERSLTKPARKISKPKSKEEMARRVA